MPSIQIIEGGVRKTISDIGPYRRAAIGVEDELARLFAKVVDGNYAILEPHRAQIEKLDERRGELQTILDTWRAAEDADYLPDLHRRLNDVLAGRKS